MLLDDGTLIAAAEGERFSWRKHSGKFPASAIEYCLREAGCTLGDIDAIAWGEEGGPGEYRDATLSTHAVSRVFWQELQHTVARETIHLVDHHRCHAKAAYIDSG